MKNKKYYIALNDREYAEIISSLINKRNSLIRLGKYTDGVDEVIMKVLKFPAFFARTNTALVLKEPKTKTSTRKVFLPKTVAEMLKERYERTKQCSLRRPWRPWSVDDSFRRIEAAPCY